MSRGSGLAPVTGFLAATFVIVVFALFAGWFSSYGVARMEATGLLPTWMRMGMALSNYFVRFAMPLMLAPGAVALFLALALREEPIGVAERRRALLIWLVVSFGAWLTEAALTRAIAALASRTPRPLAIGSASMVLLMTAMIGVTSSLAATISAFRLLRATGRSWWISALVFVAAAVMGLVPWGGMFGLPSVGVWWMTRPKAPSAA